jgi:hypothetical protein
MPAAAGQLRNKSGAGVTIETLQATPALARGFDQPFGSRVTGFFSEQPSRRVPESVRPRALAEAMAAFVLR